MNALASSIGEVTRVVGASPPLFPQTLSCGARLSARWLNPPFSGYQRPMEEHVIVAHFGGFSRGTVKTDGKSYVATFVPGTFSLCPMERDAVRASDRPMEVGTLFLGATRLRSVSEQFAGDRRIELVDRVTFRDPKLFKLLELLFDEGNPGDPGKRLFMEQLVDLISLQLLREHSAFAGPLASPPQQGLAQWQVKRVTAYMQEHLGEEIGLSELADTLNLSRFYFCTAFRVATGYTPHEWLTRLRMDLARKLLAQPAMRISDVALMAGYQTPSAFAAAFRKHVGATPTEYRRRL
jgi:AraC family transcriptional regulator